MDEEEPEALPYLLQHLSTPELAERIFNALQGLDAHGSARQELRAAGVSERRIEALYPSSFLGLLPGLGSYLRRRPNAAMYSDSHYRWLEGKAYDYAHDLNPDYLQGALWDKGTELNAARESEEFTDLEALLHDIQPEHVRDRVAKRSMVNTYLRVLWDAWWFMAHRKLLEAAELKRAESLFSLVCWGMFPYLSEQAQPELEAASA